jgi:peptidoglycan/LPS O-acetylase OafA/YrhL
MRTELPEQIDELAAAKDSPAQIATPTQIKDSSSRHANNFGFLRVLFATLVVLSHCPEMLDGNRSREILTRIFGTMSLGEVAVDGFFLISGYLILQSLMNSKSYLEYLSKRVLRIYPGYVVAFVISLWIGSLAGGRITSPLQTLLDIARAFTLHTPQLGGAFAGNPLAIVNGSMWTVSYEFRCYLLVMLLAAIGILKNRLIYLSLTGVFLFTVLGQLDFRWSSAIVAVFGQARFTEEFTFAFLLGGAFYLFRDRIVYKGETVVLALAALVPLMFVPRMAEAALLVFGGYVLFFFAFQFNSPRLNRIGSKVDLSYGIYLYAWPIQNLLIWHYPRMSPWVLFGLTVAIVSTCAYLSWTVIERPALNLKGRFLRHGANQNKSAASFT